MRRSSGSNERGGNSSKSPDAFDLDLDAKMRAAEFRQEMKSAAQRISRDAALMREAERAGIAGQVKNLVREKERTLRNDQGF